jgi:hypothetical protein
MADVPAPPFVSMVDVSIQHRPPPLHDGMIRTRENTSTTTTTTKTTMEPPLIDTSKVTENLFTKEDPYHVHKTLGFLSILSFMVRLCFVGEADMGFARFPGWTLPTIVLHLSLGLSSLVFKIPERRISEGNRIWPQFRWHSNCFVVRHSLIIILYWAEQHVLHCAPIYWANSAIVFFNLLCVDAVNAMVKDRSNTIRDLQAHPVAKYFVSAMQFIAMTDCIAGLRRASLHYYIILVVQLMAFMATLRRKNVLVGARGRRMFVFGYGLLLGISVVLGLFEYGVYSTPHELALLMAVNRAVHLIRVGGPEWLGILKSRYILWGVAVLFLNKARSSGPNVLPFGLWLAEEPQSRVLRMVSVGLLTLQITHGFVVTNRQLQAPQTSATKAKTA